MILVNEAGVVIAQATKITKATDGYIADDILYTGDRLLVYNINVPEGYQVGRCTYIDGVFEEIIIPDPEPEPEIIPFEGLKESKILEVSKDCNLVIYAGTDVTLSDGSVQHFTLTEQDQLNLSGLAIKLVSGAEQVAWHQADASQSCQYYSAQDAQLIIGTLTTFKEYHITYFRDLRIYINSLDNEESVKQVTYGMQLPEEFKSEVLRDFEKLLLGGNS